MDIRIAVPAGRHAPDRRIPHPRLGRIVAHSRSHPSHRDPSSCYRGQRNATGIDRLPYHRSARARERFARQGRAAAHAHETGCSRSRSSAGNARIVRAVDSLRRWGSRAARDHPACLPRVPACGHIRRGRLGRRRRVRRVGAGVAADRLLESRIPLDEILSGGVPRDAIPAIDAPHFARPARSTTWPTRNPWSPSPSAATAAPIRSAS